MAGYTSEKKGEGFGRDHNIYFLLKGVYRSRRACLIKVKIYQAH